MTFSPLSDHFSDEKHYVGTIYSGRVVNNNDPLKLMRVKVRISLFHQNYPDEALPWCLPIIQAPSGIGAGVGANYIPDPSSPVAVFVPLHDPVNCYYLGCVPNSNSVLSDFATNYPNAYGYVDRAGNLFKVDTQSLTWTLNLVDGSYITFENGQLNIVTTKGLSMNIQGSANINASGAVNISGSSVNLNPSSNGASSLAAKPRSTPVTQTFDNKLDY